MYTVPENNRTVPLCVDIGVEIPESMEFTITSKSKDPPDAQGWLVLYCQQASLTKIATHFLV